MCVINMARGLDRDERHSRSEEFDIDETKHRYTSRALRALVPQSLAHRALSVDVSTDRTVYDIGDVIEITIEIGNRLPIPVTIVTTSQRLWGWAIDGHLEASDERLYNPNRRNSFELDGFETKRFTVRWDGRVKRTGSPTRWVPADPGEHEIRAFVPTSDEPRSDSTTVTLR